MSEAPLIRQRVIYHGRVQGVGFRATVTSIARRHPVRGYVRNLADGTVELLSEARAPAQRRFLDEIKTTMERHISDITIGEADAIESLNGFVVRY